MSKSYEITLPGFNGSTDGTDDRVLWVIAPDDFDIATLALHHPELTVMEMSFEPETIDIDYVFPADLVGFEEVVREARTLGPVSALYQYAVEHALSDEVRTEKEAALLRALLRPQISEEYSSDSAATDASEPQVIALYAHGRVATRLLKGERDYEVQAWSLSEDAWVNVPDYDAALHNGYQFAMTHGGEPFDSDAFVTRWSWLDNMGDEAASFDTRARLAKFFYEQQGIDWDHEGSNPWGHLTDVAAVAFMYNGKIPADWHAKARERVQETLINLQLAWGEIEPGAEMVVDASPRYLVSVSSHIAPSPRLRPDAGNARTFGTKVDREWMTADQLAAVARRFGIDKASYPSPSYAEHVWWVSSTPTAEGVLETHFQLDVHELTSGEAGFHEPTAEDFQRIANVISVPFDSPMSLPEAQRVTESYLIRGAYGTLAVNHDGIVIPAKSVFEDDGQHTYRNINRVDLADYFRTRRGTEADLLNSIGEDDLVEVGYWAISKDGSEVYEPAESESADLGVAL